MAGESPDILCRHLAMMPVGSIGCGWLNGYLTAKIAAVPGALIV